MSSSIWWPWALRRSQSAGSSVWDGVMVLTCRAHNQTAAQNTRPIHLKIISAGGMEVGLENVQFASPAGAKPGVPQSGTADLLFRVPTKKVSGDAGARPAVVPLLKTTCRFTRLIYDAQN